MLRLIASVLWLAQSRAIRLGRVSQHDIESVGSIPAREPYGEDGMVILDGYDVEDMDILSEIEELIDIRELTVSNMPHLKSIPSEIVVYQKNLECLKISNCPGINKLPGKVVCMENLAEMEVSECCLNELPDPMKMPKVVRLSFSGNCLRKLPKKIDMPKLTYLDLSRNHIQKLPKSFFENMQNLEVLKIQGCVLKKVPRSILEHRSLRHVYIKASQLPEVPKNGSWYISRGEFLKEFKEVGEDYYERSSSEKRV